MKNLCNHGKVLVGQCYEYLDLIYVVLSINGKECIIQDTHTKECFKWKVKNILKLRRPYCNCDG